MANDKDRATEKAREEAFSPGTDPCPAFKLCWKLGTSRPYCADVTAHSAITGRGSAETKLLLKIEDQLINMETCLHSVVLLLDKLTSKEKS